MKQRHILGCRDTVSSLCRKEASLVLDKGINIVAVDRLVRNIVVSNIVNLRVQEINRDSEGDHLLDTIGTDTKNPYAGYRDSTREGDNRFRPRRLFVRSVRAAGVKKNGPLSLTLCLSKKAWLTTQGALSITSSTHLQWRTLSYLSLSVITVLPLRLWVMASSQTMAVHDKSKGKMMDVSKIVLILRLSINDQKLVGVVWSILHKSIFI